MTEDIDTYAKAAGHPPSASRRVLIDFDKVIRPWGDLISWDPPLEGAVEAIDRLADEGYEVVVLTSRASPTWWAAEADRRGVSMAKFGQGQLSYVRRYLRRHGISHISRVTAEKLPALVLFDDTAVTIRPDYPLGQAVADWLAQR